MSEFDNLVDGSSFGAIADYLRSPRSPITVLVHVRDKAMLGRVAEELVRERPAPGAGEPVATDDGLDRLVAEGMVRFSTQDQAADLPDALRIDPARVSRDAPCQVIWLPPYYVVHTPGLFEGKVLEDVKSPDFTRNRGGFDRER